jgi:hypothetical protein
VNSALQKAAAADEAVTYVDCGAPFFKTPKLLDVGLLPDALHPNTKGCELLASCLDAVIVPLMEAPSASGAA